MNRTHWLAGLMGLALMLAGCGETGPFPTAQEDGSGGQVAKKSSGGKKSSKKPPSKVTEKDGRKYLDDIPYDVWFDDPLGEVSNTAAVANTAAATPAPETTAKTETPPAKTEDKPAPPAGSDWATYIAADQLQEESKRIRNQLKTLLQTPATYTSDFEVVKMDGAVMAALGVIASQSDGINWKPNAGYVRDYGFEIFDSAKGPGKPNYDKTNAAYENLQSVFSGSIPAGATEPDAARPVSDVASRFYLMRRMKNAFEALKLNINTEAKLKSEAEQALHEAMMLAALSKIVSTKDYSSADEAEYQQFMNEILAQCQAAATAIKDQQFDAFSNALNTIDVTCKNCHSQYKD